MPQKKHKGGRPRAGSTAKRDVIEGIELELIALLLDIDELDQRTRQAMRRTPLVDDVLSPAVDRLVQMRESITQIKDAFDAAWEAEQMRWRTS